MATKKRSFFERLSGSVPVSDDYDAFDDDVMPVRRTVSSGPTPMNTPVQPAPAFPYDDEPVEGQLPVDVYQTPNEIVIRTFIAGVRPDEISLSISRDMVVIEGARAERDSVADDNYSVRELFWGSFSRTILLPQEIDVDNSSATAKDGLLSLILPKLDKAKQTKLRVKAG
jgi:HSP20 family molecular chaperone IbpA